MADQSLAIALGLLSAFTLALANMAVKRGEDILVGRAVLSSSAAIVIAPFALIVPLPDAATWTALAWAVPAHFAYQLCLVRAMERGDLSLVFPIMRGAAPLLTAGFAMLVLREHLPLIGWVGLVLATGAVIAFALPARGISLAAHPDKVALGWAFATAIGVALYNMADARGVRVAPSPFTYIVWLFMLDCVCITTTALLLRRRELGQAVKATWKHGVAAGGAVEHLVRLGALRLLADGGGESVGAARDCGGLGGADGRVDARRRIWRAPHRCGPCVGLRSDPATVQLSFTRAAARRSGSGSPRGEPGNSRRPPRSPPRWQRR
ncbi:DMT family transporter [Sphingomonas sp. J344]|uniref:DMT family transporter n=1 Tax=Sphingomonas sp. J344 TaxID=2898434 RepID=UPI0021508C7B|nr:DMT family transporter [Sphingomonas sp. J344]MCR5871433.1 DMT family transporter [Sphingomonas sp. J344]